MNRSGKRYAPDAQTERRQAVDFIRKAAKDCRREAEEISAKNNYWRGKRQADMFEDQVLVAIRGGQASILQEVANSIWRGHHLEKKENPV